MSTVLDEFYRESKAFVERFDAFAEKHKLEGRVTADHICYKCDSSETFEEMRRQFETESGFIFQSIISGRRIAYVKLTRIITTVLGQITFLELSDQKPDNSQRKGFDHIEVCPTLFPYASLIKTLAAHEELRVSKRPHHTTHDIDLGEGFTFRCSREPLIRKIIREDLR